MRGWLSLIVVAVTATSVAAKPGAIFIPPAEVDLGAATPMGDVVVGTSTELRAGAHWASLYWKPTRLDIGIGYAGSYRDVAPAYAARSSEYDNPTLKLHGMYFSAAYAIESHRYHRTWIGVRVEGMSGSYGGQTYNVIGGALRLASELFHTG
ncbi:MAG TPA: hypothetical protein VIV11_23640, partial [Kofleriaceae bacterium]